MPCPLPHPLGSGGPDVILPQDVQHHGAGHPGQQCRLRESERLISRLQRELHELGEQRGQLQKELQDTKYRALSTSSQITEKSRESNVLDMLKHSKDSTLHIATQPPYIINVPEE